MAKKKQKKLARKPKQNAAKPKKALKTKQVPKATKESKKATQTKGKRQAKASAASKATKPLKQNARRGRQAKVQAESATTSQGIPAGEKVAAEDTIARLVTSEYTAEDIQVLEGLEAVRQRPAMYIGDTSTRGLHHLFNEVLDNSIDEALAGHCDRIICTLHADDTVSVKDNGRGIPVDVHEKFGVSALQIVMCTLHAGGKFGGGGYHVSGGLHGVGVSCVNALSEFCEVTVERDGKIYYQKYRRGVPEAPVKIIGKTASRGTTTRWLADRQIFGELHYDPHIFKRRMRELAYLNPKVSLEFIDERNPENNETFHFATGIRALVDDINVGYNSIHKTIYFKKVREDVEVEIALQYHDGYKETLLSYANNIHTIEGGTHTTGAKTALTRAINSYARKMNMLKEKDQNFLGDDVRGGLTMVLAVKLYRPQFEGQTKTKLGNSEVEGIVNSVVGEGLAEFLEENPPIARKIVEKALTEQRVREEMRKAAEAVRRSGAVESYGLAAKLADCIEKDPRNAELFIVEGDSAAGPAKGGRDRRFQAVLPIRGKILNVERARIDKALDNTEIKALISTLGTGIDISVGRSHDEEENGKPGSNGTTGFDITKLRYHKIILMTDADVDGEHIRTLLLTFFYRYMKPLLEGGYVYFAKPPLFTIRSGKDERHYAQDEEERDRIIKELKRKDITITRFKGLGEMNPEELEETAMNPETRKLIRVHLDPEEDTEAEKMFSRLMGDKVEPRREYIERHAKEVTNLDWHY